MPTSLETIDDHRVIIIPKIYKIIKTDKLVFDNGIKVKECLIAQLKTPNEDDVVIFNLHIHWQSKELDYIRFAKLIKNYMESNYTESIPFIICGDFNGSIDSSYLINFIQEINDGKFKLDTNSITYSDDFTSHDTRNKDSLSWIDHILSFNLSVKVKSSDIIPEPELI